MSRILSIFGLVIVLSMVTAGLGTVYAQQAKNVTLDNAQTVNITATNAELNGESVPQLQIILNINSIPGQSGAQGPAGENGQDGAPGPQGDQGIQGPPGKDGQNGTIIIDVPQIENSTGGSDIGGGNTTGGNVTTDVPVIGNVTDDNSGNVTDNSGNVTDNSGNVTSPIEPEVPITPPQGNSTEPLPPVIIDNGDNGTVVIDNSGGGGNDSVTDPGVTISPPVKDPTGLSSGNSGDNNDDEDNDDNN